MKYGGGSHIFYSPPSIIIYTVSGLFWDSETNQERRGKRRSVLPVNSGIKSKGSTPILLVQSSWDISFLSRGYRSERWWHTSASQGWLVRNYAALNFQSLNYIIKKMIPLTRFLNSPYEPVASQVKFQKFTIEIKGVNPNLKLNKWELITLPLINCPF